MKKFCVILVCAVCALGFALQPAIAIPPFQKVFYAEYVDGNNNAAYAAAVKEVKCNLCHDANSKSKKDRNPYGAELSVLLDKKVDKDNADKVKEALGKVAAMKSADDGPTYGELIKSGKLPGGQ
jgi:hypothetical protein